MEHVKQFQVDHADADDSMACDPSEKGGEECTKPRPAYSAPKLERLGTVAEIALFSGGGSTFF